MPNIHIHRPWEIPEREVTPEECFLDRRELVKRLGLGVGALSIGAGSFLGRLAAQDESGSGFAEVPKGLLDPAVGKRFADRFPAKRNEKYDLGGLKLTPEPVAAAYNNFYEFTMTKELVWRLAQGYPVDPWKVEVTGLVKKPRTLDLETIFTKFPLEERLYRFRCVEAWAMQVPWTGFPLKSLIDYLEPQSSAKYVRFISVLDRDKLPGQRSMRHYPWPYYEAFRMDEATNELAFVAVGSYGHALPMQHGAPWRLVFPWKYGFKSPKSMVKIEFHEKKPTTFWNDAEPKEYGFYSNIDPSKPHPRWSQATERDIATRRTRKTLPYGGYAEQVAKMYDGTEY